MDPRPLVPPPSPSLLLTSPAAPGTPHDNFKLLGAAIGELKWCEHPLSKKRVAKASALIQVIGRYGDAHGAFTLHRSFAGWAKIVYSCGTVPPTPQPDALAQADPDIRGALGRLVGSPLSDDDWRLASSGISAGGIGARSAREHAPAAYVASLTATAVLSARNLACLRRVRLRFWLLPRRC